MDIRKAVSKIVLAKLRCNGMDDHLVKRQLADLPLSRLCDMSEVPMEYVDNRAVFDCHGIRHVIVLWRQAWIPHATQRHHESYNAAPMVLSDLEAYRCPITGKPITSRSQHRENLKRHGCEVAEPDSRPKSSWQQDKKDDFDRKKAVYDAMSQIGYH